MQNIISVSLILYENAPEVYSHAITSFLNGVDDDLEDANDWRPTGHAYATLFGGASKFVNGGGFLPANKAAFIKEQLKKAVIHFPNDTKLLAVCQKLKTFAVLQ